MLQHLSTWKDEPKKNADGFTDNTVLLQFARSRLIEASKTVTYSRFPLLIHTA